MSDSAFDQGKIQLIVDDCLLDCAGIFDRYIDFDFRVLFLIDFDKGGEQAGAESDAGANMERGICIPGGNFVFHF
mgnify:FL=1